MQWFWLILVLIILCAILAMIFAVRIRRRRLEKRIQVQIQNLGNVESSYQLRADAPSGELEFWFMLKGARLPELMEGIAITPMAPEVANVAPNGAPPQRPASSEAKLSGAISFGTLIATFLRTLASFLPQSISSPLNQAASQMSNATMKASQVQQASDQAGQLTQQARSPTRQVTPGAQRVTDPVRPTSAPQVSGAMRNVPAWAETPAILPGEMLTVDLYVRLRARSILKDVKPAFQVKSRSTGLRLAARGSAGAGGTEASEEVPGALVVEQGQVLIRGGFWSHRIFPHLLILVVLLVSIMLVARWYGF